MLSKEILEKGQNEFFLQNSFSYSADVKPVINKNQLNLSSKHKYMLSLCIYCDLYGPHILKQRYQSIHKISILDSFCLNRTWLIVKWRHLVVTFSLEELSSNLQVQRFILHYNELA